MDLRTEGGIEMLKYFRNAVYSKTAVGDLLLMHVQVSQLESGLPIALLEHPFIRRCVIVRLPLEGEFFTS